MEPELRSLQSDSFPADLEVQTHNICRVVVTLQKLIHPFEVRAVPRD